MNLIIKLVETKFGTLNNVVGSWGFPIVARVMLILTCVLFSARLVFIE